MGWRAPMVPFRSGCGIARPAAKVRLTLRRRSRLYNEGKLPMRLLLSALVLCGAPLFSQQLMPVGFVRGSLLSWQGSNASGNLTVRRADGEVYGCSYDAHTLFQRDQWPIHVADLNAGEPVEVLSDRRPLGCYARMLSVVHRMPEPAGWRPRAVE